MFTSPARFLLTLAATFALLLTMWVTAAKADTHADTSFEVHMVTSQGSDAAQRAMRCYRRPLVQGTVGESVLVCDTEPSAAPAVAKRAAKAAKVRKSARVGHTVVIARLGARI